MLEFGKEALNAPSLSLGDTIIFILIFAVTAGRNDRLSALIENDVMQAIGVIGPIGKDLACVQISDEFTGGRHIALLTGPQFEADRQAERIDDGVDFRSETASRATESLGLHAPLFRRPPAAWACA